MHGQSIYLERLLTLTTILTIEVTKRAADTAQDAHRRSASNQVLGQRQSQTQPLNPRQHILHVVLRPHMTFYYYYSVINHISISTLIQIIPIPLCQYPLFHNNTTMPPFPILSIIALTLLSVQAAIGYDTVVPYSQQTLQCLKSSGVSFVIIAGYEQAGHVNKNATAALKNIQAVGLDSDIYIFPCKTHNATKIVQETMNSIPSNLYGRVWVNVEINPVCGWNVVSTNCAYIKEMVNAIKSRGKKAGIYSGKGHWGAIMGSLEACPELASEPLWYTRQNGIQSFDDFEKFGGWDKPAMKQYNIETRCEVTDDYNYYP